MDRRTRLLRGLRVLATLLALGFALAVLGGAWDDARAVLGDMSAAGIIASVAFAAASLVVSGMGWRVALSAQGGVLPVGEAVRLFCATQVGKYVTGSVWPVLAQTEAMRRRGLPAAAPAVAYVLTLLVGLDVVALLAVPALAGWLGPVVAAVVGAGAVAVAAVALLAPARVRTGAEAVLARLHRRLPAVGLAPGPLLGVMAWTLASWLLLGASILAIAVALGAGWGPAAVAASAFALAWAAGFLVPFLPAGVGLREGVLVLVAAPAVGAGTAAAVALLSRLVLVVADAAVGAVSIGASATRAAAQPPSGSGESV